MNSLVPIGNGTEPDGEILGRFVRQHDEVAFRTLISRHRRLIYSVCSRSLQGRSSEVEDAAQTVLLILARKAPTLVGNPNLGGWIYRTCQYVALNIRRREDRKDTAIADLVAIATDDSVSESDRWREAREVLDEVLLTIPANQRDALVLHYFDGKSLDEIGKEIGVSRNTIRTRILLGRQKLRKKFEQRGITLSLAALVAGLEAEGKELPIGDFRLPIGENAGVPEGIRNTADAVMAEMDRAAAKAMWGWIGATAAGLAVVGVGVALVANNLRSEQPVPVTTTSWRVESVIGNPSVRRGGAIVVMKAGDLLCFGDRIVTSSNQEVQVVSDAGDRVLVREEGEVRFEHPTSNIQHRTSKLGEGDSQVRVVYGAVVAKARRSVRFETPHAEVETTNVDFFLMVVNGLTTNGAPWSFTRLDMTAGTAKFLPFSVSNLTSEIPLVARQAICAGTDHAARTIETVARKSDGREFSPKYAGVLFAEAAQRCNRGEYMLDDPSRRIVGRTIVKTPLQMKAAAEAMNPLVSNGSIVAEENRLQVIATNGIRLVPFDVPTLDGKRRSIRYELCVLGAGVPRQSTFLRGYTDDVPVGLEPRHFGAKPTPVDKGQWVAFAQTWIQVGRLPNGSPVVEWAEQIGDDCVFRTFSTWNFEEPGGPFFKVVAGHVALKNVVFTEE